MGRAMVVKYDEMPFSGGRDIIGIHSKPFVVYSVGASLVKFDKGAEFPYRSHPDEQINYVLEGKMEWHIKDDDGERTEILTKGMIIGIEPYVLHGVKTLEDSLTFEVYGPGIRFRKAAEEIGLIVSKSGSI